MQDRRNRKPARKTPPTRVYKVLWFFLKAFVIYLAIMAHIPGAFALRAESRGRARTPRPTVPSIPHLRTPTKVVDQPVIFSSDGKNIFTSPLVEPALMEQLQHYFRHVALASLDAARVQPTAETPFLMKLAEAQITPILIQDPFLDPVYRAFKNAGHPLPWANQLTKNPEALNALQRNAFQGDFDASSLMGFYHYALGHYEDGMAFLMRSVILALNYHGHAQIDPTNYSINFLKMAMKELKRLTHKFEIKVNSPEFEKRKPSIVMLIDVMESLNEKIEGIDRSLAGHNFGVKQLHQMVNVSVKTARELYSKEVVETASSPNDQPRMVDDALLKQLYAFGFRQLALQVIKASPKAMANNGDEGASYSSRGVQLDWRPQTMQQLPSDEKKLETIISAARSGNHVASAYLSDYFFELYSKDNTPTGRRSLSFWPLVLIEQACLQHELAYYHEKALALYADLPEKHWPTTQIYIVIWHATRFLDLATEIELGELSPKVRALVKKYGDEKINKPVELMFDPHLDPVVDVHQDSVDFQNFVLGHDDDAQQLRNYVKEKPHIFKRVQGSAARGDLQATLALSNYYYMVDDLQKALVTATQCLMLRRAYPDTQNKELMGWFIRVGLEYLESLQGDESNLYYTEARDLINLVDIFIQKMQALQQAGNLEPNYQNSLQVLLRSYKLVRARMGLRSLEEELAVQEEKLKKAKSSQTLYGFLFAGCVALLLLLRYGRKRTQVVNEPAVVPPKKVKKTEPPVVEVVAEVAPVPTETPEQKAARIAQAKAEERAQREIERQERERAKQAEKVKNYKDALSYVTSLREVIARFTPIPQSVQNKMTDEKAKLPDLTKQMEAHEKADNKTRATAQWKKDKKDLQTQIESCNKHVAHCEETNRVYAEFIKEAEALLKNGEEKGGVEQAYPFETHAADLSSAVAGLQSKQTKLEKEMPAVSSAIVQPVEEQEHNEENDRYKKCQKELLKLKKEFREFSERYISDITGMRNERDAELIGQCDKAVEICCTWVDWLANKNFDAMEREYFIGCVESLVEMKANLKSKREEIRQRYEESLVRDENEDATPIGKNNNNDERFVKRANLPKGAVAQSVGSFLVEVRREVEQDFPGQQGEKEKRRELKAKAKQEAAAKKQEEARNPIAIALDARMRDMQQMLCEKDFKDHRLLLHRALQYRMVRLMLLLEIIVTQKNKEALKPWYQNLAAHFTSDEYKRFAIKFSNRLVHYYFVMGDSAESFESKDDTHPDPDGLISCVKECFATREKLSKKLPEKIKKTKLWKLFKDIEKSESRSADVLFEECILKFREFLHFHIKFREKYDNPVKLPIFNSACKMLLILIGENFARLCDLHPEINTLAKDENAQDPAHQMIIDLNRLRHRRNLEKHEMDLKFDEEIISDDMIKEFQGKAENYCLLLGDLHARVIPRVVVGLNKQ